MKLNNPLKLLSFGVLGVAVEVAYERSGPDVRLITVDVDLIIWSGGTVFTLT